MLHSCGAVRSFIPDFIAAGIDILDPVQPLAAGLDPAFYAHRERSADEVLPWDHLFMGVEREFLRREYDRALAEAATPDCADGTCTHCGAGCDPRAGAT